MRETRRPASKSSSKPGANDPQLTLAFFAAARGCAPAIARTRRPASAQARAPGLLFAGLAALLLALDLACRARQRRAVAARRLEIPSVAPAAALIAARRGARGDRQRLPRDLSREELRVAEFRHVAALRRIPDAARLDLDRECSSSSAPAGSERHGAIMWAHIPYSFVQHRALAEGELPLWNRYNSLGSPLLEPGPVDVRRPAAPLRDSRERRLVGVGLEIPRRQEMGSSRVALRAAGAHAVVGAPAALVRRFDRGGRGRPRSPAALPPALIVTVAAPFVGFFVYRINHPAFFSMCYAPWALYCWVRVAQAVGARATAWWAAGLIVANAALMNSGTVKEAYMLLLCMNFSGACVLLAYADAPWRT